ncbi:MAG: hypothetical protein E5V59_05405 [Mesorhizobium sp.]|nr:MAG: hypothetical protein E5V59_05405 [Mesorhizobium sp.]
MFLMAGCTLQSLIDGGTKITVHCAHCSYIQVLDLELLRNRYGPEASAMPADLLPKMRCRNCEGRTIGLSYAPDLTSIVDMGRSNAGNDHA